MLTRLRHGIRAECATACSGGPSQRGLRPTSAYWSAVSAGVRTRPAQPSARREPGGNGDAHCVAAIDHRREARATRSRPASSSPAGGKPCSRSASRMSGMTIEEIGHEDRRRRGDWAVGRAVLQSRHGIGRPAEAPNTFGPVKAVGERPDVRRGQRVLGLIDKQDGSRVGKPGKLAGRRGRRRCGWPAEAGGVPQPGRTIGSRHRWHSTTIAFIALPLASSQHEGHVFKQHPGHVPGL